MSPNSITALGEAAHFKRSLKYEVELDDKGRVVSSTVTVPTTKKLPVLPARLKLTPAEKKEWDRFNKELKKHENGHERIMHQYLDNLHLKLASSKNKDDAEGKFQKVMAVL